MEELKKIAARLPAGVRAFALDPNYWDPTSQMCPHDGWVQDLVIREEPQSADLLPPEARQDRAMSIKLILLGWSHTNLLTLSYQKVVRYLIQMDRLSQSGNRAHGDWLHDSITLGVGGRVVHTIKFSSGANWTIECNDIFLSTQPLPARS